MKLSKNNLIELKALKDELEAMLSHGSVGPHNDNFRRLSILTDAVIGIASSIVEAQAEVKAVKAAKVFK